MQLWPLGQALPHAPQLYGSIERSEHSPLHDTNPAAHAPLHCSSEQTCPEAHGVVQPPQYCVVVGVWQ